MRSFFQKKIQQVTHLLKLVDKMSKYEVEPASIVEHTEHTQKDRQTRWNQYTHFTFVEAGGIINVIYLNETGPIQKYLVHTMDTDAVVLGISSHSVEYTPFPAV